MEQQHISGSRHEECDGCLEDAGCETVLLTVPRQGSAGVLINNITFIHQAEYMLI